MCLLCKLKLRSETKTWIEPLEKWLYYFNFNNNILESYGSMTFWCHLLKGFSFILLNETYKLPLLRCLSLKRLNKLTSLKHLKSPVTAALLMCGVLCAGKINAIDAEVLLCILCISYPDLSGTYELRDLKRPVLRGLWQICLVCLNRTWVFWRSDF